MRAAGVRQAAPRRIEGSRIGDKPLMLRRAVNWLTGREGEGPAATGSADALIPAEDVSGPSEIAPPAFAAAPPPSLSSLPASRSVMLTLAAGAVPAGPSTGPAAGFT